jgi:hypothetical protein
MSLYCGGWDVPSTLNVGLSVAILSAELSVTSSQQ